MSYIYSIIILNCYVFMFVLSNPQIINNPIKSDKESNEINYILILQSNTVYTTSSQSLSIKKDFVRFFFNSYIFTPSLFLCKDESSNYFLLVKYKYYKIELSSEKEIEKVLYKNDLNSGNKYLGYITGSQSAVAQISLGTYLCATNNNEIIIYGKSGNKKIFFYVLSEDEYYYISIGNIDDLISCKLLKGSIYICIYSIDSNIMIAILALTCPVILFGSVELKLLYTNEVTDFSGYQNHILYDTSKSYYKILCAKSKDTNNIECMAININILYRLFLTQPSIELKLIKLNNNYHAYFSYIEDNCNYTKYNSEYLICCGKNATICERRDLNFNKKK